MIIKIKNKNRKKKIRNRITNKKTNRFQIQIKNK